MYNDFQYLSLLTDAHEQLKYAHFSGVLKWDSNISG